MTSNHHQDQIPAQERPDGALLAGVCAGLSGRLGWNVWAIRALFIIGLFIQTIGAGVVYVILAVSLPRFGSSTTPEPELKTDELRADELSNRQQRIAELEKRFKEMENGQ